MPLHTIKECVCVRVRVRVCSIVSEEKKNSKRGMNVVVMNGQSVK